MNFTYLESKKDMDKLRAFCEEAEEYALSNSNISITAARKAVEYIVKFLYASIVGWADRSMSLFDMLSDPTFSNYVSDTKVIGSIHVIRKMGNASVHEGNMSSEDALLVLENLHFVVGEVCVLLGLMEDYPVFNKKAYEDNYHKQIARDNLSRDDSEVPIDYEFIVKFAPRLRNISNWIPTLRLLQVTQEPIDVHVKTKDEHNLIQSKLQSVGTDSGADGKLAMKEITAWIAANSQESEVFVDMGRSCLTILVNGIATVVCVKTGSTVLGKKDYVNGWVLLPNIDFVIYSPEIDLKRPIEDQFVVFTREEFISMWEKLNLIRYKVSSAAAKRYKQQYGTSAKNSNEECADLMTVQSYKNSNKKYKAVLDWCRNMPSLKENCADIINRAKEIYDT